jgi:hypothetical protein
VRGCDRRNNEVPVNPSTFSKSGAKSTFHKLRCEKVEQKIKTTSVDSNGEKIKIFYVM